MPAYMLAYILAYMLAYMLGYMLASILPAYMLASKYASKYGSMHAGLYAFFQEDEAPQAAVWPGPPSGKVPAWFPREHPGPSTPKQGSD